MSQHETLKKTYQYMMERKSEIKEFFQRNSSRKFVFFGCGSSYMLSKSANRIFSTCPNTSSVAIAGGDYLINPEYFEETIKGSIIVTLSRSGQTSEIVRDIQYIKEQYGNPVISISMMDHNDIMPYSDLDLTLDWCYDKSVCQTRTVTNLYAVLLFLSAVYNQDEDLMKSIELAVTMNEAYKLKYRPVFEQIAKKNWMNVVVLADGALTGIAEEGALAFTEIAMLPGQCFNMLDYRHGPKVLNTEQTLTICILQPREEKLQADMLRDLKQHKGTMVTVSDKEENIYDVDAHVCVGDIPRFEAWGIPFIYVMQMISYSKSIALGRNPDAPTGLDAFITL